MLPLELGIKINTSGVNNTGVGKNALTANTTASITLLWVMTHWSQTPLEGTTRRIGVAFDSNTTGTQNTVLKHNARTKH